MSVAELASSLPRPARASELQAVLKAERTGSPFVVHRDADGTLCILRLTGERARQTIGRRGSNDIALPWDDQVSRVHAELERIGDCWAVADDGLSTNGTFLNGSRVGARRRPRDGDCIRVGSSVLLVRDPAQHRGSRASPDPHRAVLPAVP